MRKTFEMTEEDLAAIIEGSKPTRAMFLSGGQTIGGTPQENANRAWVALGEKMGFDSMTVRPTGEGDRFFSALPSGSGSTEEDAGA